MPLLFTSQPSHSTTNSNNTSSLPNPRYTINKLNNSNNNNSNHSTKSAKLSHNNENLPLFASQQSDANANLEPSMVDYSPIIMKLNQQQQSQQTNTTSSFSSQNQTNTTTFTNTQSSLFRVLSNANNVNNTSFSHNNLITSNNHHQQARLSSVGMQPSNHHRASFILPSNATINSNSSSKQPPLIKTKRSGSITTLLPLKTAETTTNNLPLTNNTTTVNSVNNNNTNNNVNIVNGMNRPTLGGNKVNKPNTILKRRKSNSLSIIDYCNIINMNTNYQMLANFYDDTEESMARLSMKTTKNANIQKQASLSEQMAALFGSSMCTCYLCNLKTSTTDNNNSVNVNNNATNGLIVNNGSISNSLFINNNNNNNGTTTNVVNVVNANNVVGNNGNGLNSTNSNSSGNFNSKKVHQHNFEITPNKNNSDFSVMKYTYSTPFSQLSTLKLFNLMNTDCSINFIPEQNQQKNQNNDQTTTTTNGNISNQSIYTTLPNINNNNATNNTNNNNISTNTNAANSINPPPIANFMQINSNSPPIYDTRYLYLIDCRLNKEKFKKSRIHTSIHYSDLLNDSIYLSPPTDNYTLIVLYDEDGTFLTSSPSPITNNTTTTTTTSSTTKSNFESPSFNSVSSSSTLKNSNKDEPCPATISSDELIMKIKSKINCSSHKTIYILSGGYEQFLAKFPFMCSSLEIRSTTDRHKYLTIYPNCVIENQIYIGSGIQAKNWKIIRDLQITHILNCSIEHECVFQSEIKYLHVKIEDSYQENIYKVISKALRFIEEAFEKYYSELAVYNEENAPVPLTPSSRNSSASNATSMNRMSSGGLNVRKTTTTIPQPNRPKRPVFLIHCNLGISRSSSILIAYLINKYKLCLYAAFNYVKDKRLQIAPNYSFLRQLKQFEEEFY